MKNSVNITIDPGFLVIPGTDCSAIEAELFIESLLQINSLKGEPSFSVLMSERAIEALIDDELYPLRDSLEKLFRIHNIVVADVNTIANFIKLILNSKSTLETKHRINELELEGIETTPDITQSVELKNLRKNLERCIAITTILRNYYKNLSAEHVLMLKNISKCDVNVKIQSCLLDHNNENISISSGDIISIDGKVPVGGNEIEIIEILDEFAIFVNSTNDSEIELAIRIAYYKYVNTKESNEDWRMIPNLKIGNKFRILCQKICNDQTASLPPKILRSILETLRKENLSAVHALRTGKGGSNPQRLRNSDNAKAMRRDIDREFHLHYWDCPDGNLELASVVYHNDFTIPD